MNARRRTSLIRNLHYFEAVARNLSLTNAANELGVTASAVSHQLRELQTVMGEKLLERSGRGVVLTLHGQKLYERLSAAFGEIEDSVAEVIGSAQPTLRLAVCSSFGPGWLIERLPSFKAHHPEIDIQLQLYDRNPQLTDSVADAFVTTENAMPGYDSSFILEERLVAIRAPGATAGMVTPLITTDIDKGRVGADWIEYCQLRGLSLEALHDGKWFKCSHYLFAAEMARNGMGTAIVPDFLVARDIAEGRLIPVGGGSVPAGRSYFLTIKTTRRKEPSLQALALWFKAQPVSRSQPASLKRVV